MKVAILNYGIGNLGSVVRAIEELGFEPVVAAHPEEMQAADRLILPGVGNFSHCKKLLDRDGWTAAVIEQVAICGKPLLGICLGMQLLAEWGSEGAEAGEKTRGLGLIPGEVTSLTTMGCKARIPHVGWNDINVTKASPLLRNISSGTDFYFVHGFAFNAMHEEDVIATTEHDCRITAVVSRNNVSGTQFHPEKSSRAGLTVLKNFIESAQC